MIRDNYHASILQEGYVRYQSPYSSRHEDEFSSPSPLNNISRNRWVTGLTLEDATWKRCNIEDSGEVYTSVWIEAKSAEKQLLKFTYNNMCPPHASAGVRIMARYGIVQNRKVGV